MAPPANGSAPHPDHEVVVIGGGFSGIGAAIKVAEAGIHDFVVIEAGDGVGGAWHWNTYPGIAVDIPSPSYQFSFEQMNDWSRLYAPGSELKGYAEHLVDKYGLRPKLRFNTKITNATFDESTHAWTLETDGGEEVTTRFVIGATGVFSQPRIPDIAGVDAFEGEMLHTARWDDGIAIDGKRVGIIGTGASAVQVIPAIAPARRSPHRLSADTHLVPSKTRPLPRWIARAAPGQAPRWTAPHPPREPDLRRALISVGAPLPPLPADLEDRRAHRQALSRRRGRTTRWSATS